MCTHTSGTHKEIPLLVLPIIKLTRLLGTDGWKAMKPQMCKCNESRVKSVLCSKVTDRRARDRIIHSPLNV